MLKFDNPGDRVYIAAHRGACGGNIPCNTLLAYDIAVRQGADIIELDVSKSADGELFCFHPGMEPVMYSDPALISEIPADRAAERRLRNCDRTETRYAAPKLDEAFELLKGRCIIAIDKFWMNMAEIGKAVRAHGLESQVLCKLPADEAAIRRARGAAPGLALLPLAHGKDTVCLGLAEAYPEISGVEVIFAEETDPVASDAYISAAHRAGLALWCNSIIYDEKSVLAAGHSDDASLSEGPEKGWGWLCGKGFDIIQTDWTAELRRYLDAGIMAAEK